MSLEDNKMIIVETLNVIAEDIERGSSIIIKDRERRLIGNLYDVMLMITELHKQTVSKQENIMFLFIIGIIIGGLVGSFLFPNGKFNNPQKG